MRWGRRRVDCGKEKIWAGCNYSSFVVPWIVCCNGVKVFAVRVARNEVKGCGVDGG